MIFCRVHILASLLCSFSCGSVFRVVSFSNVVCGLHLLHHTFLSCFLRFTLWSSRGASNKWPHLWLPLHSYCVQSRGENPLLWHFLQTRFRWLCFAFLKMVEVKSISGNCFLQAWHVKHFRFRLRNGTGSNSSYGTTLHVLHLLSHGFLHSEFCNLYTWHRRMFAFIFKDFDGNLLNDFFVLSNVHNTTCVFLWHESQKRSVILCKSLL